MTAKTHYAKRIISVAIALVLVLGTVFSSAVSAGAASLADGLTGVATVNGDYHKGAQDYRTVTDLQGGGVKLKYTNYSAYMPYVTDENISTQLGIFPGTHGLQLQFANYKNNNTATGNLGNGILAIALTVQKTNSKAKLKPGVPFIQIDTNEGTVKLMHGISDSIQEFAQDEVIVSANDTLKKANFEGKPFTVTVAPYDAQHYLVAVDVNGTAVAGLMTKSLLYAQQYAPSDTNPVTFVSIGSIDNLGTANNKWEVEYYGYKKLDSSYTAPEITTPSDPVTPPPVTPPESSSLADGLTEVATVEKEYNPWNDNERTVTNIQGGGVEVAWNTMSGYGPYRFNVNMGEFPADGIMLQFANYKIKDTTSSSLSGYGQFVICLSSTQANDGTKIKKDVPFLQVDTKTGSVTLRHCLDTSFGTENGWSDDQTVISNSDVLKYANIKEKPFTVTITKDQNNDFVVEFNVDGQKVSGVMSRSVYDNIAKHANELTTYMSIGGPDNNGAQRNGWSIEFYGYKKLSLAPPASNLADGLTVVATTEKEYNPWDDNERKVTNIAGGGVAVAWNTMSGYGPYRFNANMGEFPGDGIMLQFANYEIKEETPSTVSGYGKFAICLSSTQANDGTKVKKDVPFLLVDTVKGSVTLRHCLDNSFGTENGWSDDQVIIENSNLIKYANIKGKPFAVTVSKNSDKDYVVEFDINGQKVSGVMSRSVYDNIAKHANALTTYMSIGGPDNNGNEKNGWSIEFYGYKKLEIPAPTVDTSALTEFFNPGNSLYGTTDYKKMEALQNGGTLLTYLDSYASYSPYSYESSLGEFPGAGYKLVLSNYVNAATLNANNEKAYGQIAIVLSDTYANAFTKLKKGVAFLQLDTVKGRLLLRHCTDDSLGVETGFETDQIVIDECDLLKYEKLARKVITISFKASETSQGNVDVIVEIGGDGNKVAGEKVSGVLNMKILNTLSVKAGAAFYVSIGGVDDNKATVINPWSIEIYGYQNFGILSENTLVTQTTKDELIAEINALTNTATLADSNAILSAKAKYDAFTNKAEITNSAKLIELVQDLNALRQQNKQKPTSSYIAREPDKSLTKPQFSNPHNRSLYSFVTDNGFKAEWRGATSITSGHTTYLNQGVYGSFPLDGLRLFVEDFDFDATKSSDFWFHFTSGNYSDALDGTLTSEKVERLIAIRMGLTKGRLEINGVGMENSWYAGNTDILLRDNLKGKQIIFEWAKQSNGDYICYITVGEEVVAFKVAKEKIAAMDDFDENDVRVVIGTANTKAVFSMEVTGISGKSSDAVQNVIASLKAFPKTVTSKAQVQTFEKIEKAYNALSIAQKQQVTNVKDLTAARAAVRAFEGVDAEGKDKDGYYIPKNPIDVYGDSQKEEIYCWTENSVYGGLAFDFNNAGYGLKNGFKNHHVLDGISIRFDNYNYANDTSLAIGFESSPQKCKLYDKGGGTARRGIWLIIGNDNTIYSTNPPREAEGCIALFEPNEKLSAQNLMNKEFFISWKVNYLENDKKTYTMTFTVDNTDFTYTYDAAYLERLDLFNDEDIEIVLNTMCGMNPGYYEKYGTVQPCLKQSALSIDITGFKYEKFSASQRADIQEVIDAIDKLPDTASYDIAEDIDEIWDAYQKLIFKEMRLAVTNHDKLINLYNQLFKMQVADGTMYDEQDVPDDDYIDNNGEDDVDDYVDDQEIDNNESSEQDETQQSNKKPVKKPAQKVVYDYEINWALIAIIAGAALIVIAIAIIVIVRVTKNKKEEK